MVVLTIVLVVWGIVLQAPLEQPASSTVAPNPSKAPWYFLGLQEMLVYFDPWMAGVRAAQHDHRRPDGDPLHRHQQGRQRLLTRYNDRKFAYITFQYGFVVLWVVLILLGTFLRGPNWNFFGPYEYWDLHKLIPLNNVQPLGHHLDPAPGHVQADELSWSASCRGSCSCLAYFTAHAATSCTGSFFKKYVEQAGMLRYMTLAVLMLFMAVAADQDGAALDDQPEIHGGDPRVLLQYLTIDRA